MYIIYLILHPKGYSFFLEHLRMHYSLLIRFTNSYGVSIFIYCCPLKL